VQLLKRSLTQRCAEVDACPLQQQPPPRSPPDWQRRPTWASEWAAQHALQSGAVQQSGGGGGGGGGAFDGMDVAGGSSGGDTPMRSMAYLQQQELRYISAGI
jgi:hypothetical protein